MDSQMEQENSLMNPQEVEAMSRMADVLNQRRKNSALETTTKMDLQNLKFDPAKEAMKASQDVETEEEGIKYEQLRRLRVLQLSKAQQDQTKD